MTGLIDTNSETWQVISVFLDEQEKRQVNQLANFGTQVEDLYRAQGVLETIRLLKDFARPRPGNNEGEE